MPAMCCAPAQYCCAPAHCCAWPAAQQGDMAQGLCRFEQLKLLRAGPVRQASSAKQGAERCGVSSAACKLQAHRRCSLAKRSQTARLTILKPVHDRKLTHTLLGLRAFWHLWCALTTGAPACAKPGWNCPPGRG